MNVVEGGVPIDELVAVVKDAIKHANVSTTDTGRDLRVVSMYLKLNVVATTTLGGRLEFQIPVVGMRLKVGRSITRQDTHIVEMELVPEDLAPGHEIRDGAVERVLVDAVETLRAVMALAGRGDDPFVLHNGTVELSFAVTDDGAISLGVDGESKGEITHTLRLGLEIPTGRSGVGT